MRVWLRTDLAYAAGLVDGEGSIVISMFRKKKYPDVPAFSARIAVINTDRAIHEWLVKTFGGNILQKTKSAPTSKVCWEWQIYGAEADRLAQLIYPYLRIKKEQLEIFMRFRASMRGRAAKRPRRRLHKWEVDQRIEWIRQIRVFTRQGVS